MKSEDAGSSVRENGGMSSYIQKDKACGWHLVGTGDPTAIKNSSTASYRNANLELDKTGLKGNKENKDQVSNIYRNTPCTVYVHVRWNYKPLKSEQEAECVRKYIKIVPNKLYSKEEDLTITIALLSEKDSIC